MESTCWPPDLSATSPVCRSLTDTAVDCYAEKVKVAHTRLPSVVSGADPGSLQSACR